ncbi:MAG: tyrosine-type recombinase/integrase [Candidatus Aenigmatarchaeota archaeon]
MEKVDIHNYEERLKDDLKRLEKDKGVLKSNKELIKKFVETSVYERLSKGRVSRYVQCLHKICKWVRKDLKKVNKNDILVLLRKIEESGFSPWTVSMYRVIIRKFFKWLGKEDLVKDIKIHVKLNETKLPEELLTEEDVKKLIEKCDNLRDKALIACLYESAGRPGEILGMRIMDVTFDEYGALIVLTGKTGMRKIRLLIASPYLANWIENHPFKQDKSSPLWILTGNVGKYQPMTYAALVKVIRKAAKLAGLKKTINPYLFRHSRLTQLAKFLTEQELKFYAGWTQASKMAATYVHLSARDIDEAILGKVYGIKRVEKEKVESKMEPIVCVRCKTINEATNSFCRSCGMPLTLQASFEIEERRKIIDEWMLRLMGDPKVLKAMIEGTEKMLNEELPKEFKKKLIQMLSE